MIGDDGEGRRGRNGSEDGNGMGMCVCRERALFEHLVFVGDSLPPTGSNH